MVRANTDDSYKEKNIRKTIDFNNERNKLYFSRRKELKNLMKSINSYLDNNSQSYFLTIYYMDLIFTHPDLEKIFFSHFNNWDNYSKSNDIQMSNYVLLSLACLVVASKFNENDPHVPTMASFIRILYELSKKKYIFNLDALFSAELVVLKILKYKLNYYTLYHYLIFFFTHGVVFKKTIENSKVFKKYSERKILEKIYIMARELLDVIIDFDKNYDLFIGKSNYIVVAIIFIWSIEQTMNIKLKPDENIFKLIFNINISEQKQKDVYEIIKKLSTVNNNSKKEINNENKEKNNNKEKDDKISNKFVTKDSKDYYINRNETSSNEQTLNSSKTVCSDSNFKFNIEPKSSVASANSNTNTKVYTSSQIIDIIDNNFQFYNGLIHDELDNFKSNYPKKLLGNQNQSKAIIKRERRIPKSNANHCSNKRENLSCNKNINSSSFQNYSEINKKQKNNLQTFKTSNQNIKPPKKEKEPTDNNKSSNLNKNNNETNNAKVIKTILSNKVSNSSKKSFSVSKNQNKITNNLNCQIRPSAKINYNIENKLKLDENIKNTQILKTEKDFNNHCSELIKNNQQNQQEESNIIKNNKIKKFQQVKKKILKKLNNCNNISEKNMTRFVNLEEIINQSTNICEVKKLSSTIELEPQDNINRLNKKYYIGNNINNNINKTFNNNFKNTIMINNNIHINAYFDKNDFVQKDLYKGSFEGNMTILNTISVPKDKNRFEKNKQKSTNKNKNLRNNQKKLTEIKNYNDQINNIILHKIKKENNNNIQKLKAH